VKTHALSLLRTKNLRYAMLRFQDFQRKYVLDRRNAVIRDGREERTLQQAELALKILRKPRMQRSNKLAGRCGR
jgi:ribosome-binding protein aMBF1 (putative translation factor)